MTPTSGSGNKYVVPVLEKGMWEWYVCWTAYLHFS